MILSYNTYFHLRPKRLTPAFMTLLILLFAVAGLQDSQGQQNDGISSPNESAVTKTVKHPSPLPQPSTSTRVYPFQRDISLAHPISVDFSIDWTNCQIHLLNADQPIEFTLTGSIASPNPIMWILDPVPQGFSDSPNLVFIEDVLGRAGLNYGSNIPLIWEIALDGGAFLPMTIQPDNSISTVFPPGVHTFRVRITGVPQNHQNDGYYHLQLEQCLVPEM